MELNVKVGMCSSANGCDMAFDSKWVEWTPELQEAWDRQQEMELVNDDYCPVCETNVNCYEFSKYCSNCGQKIKR